MERNDTGCGTLHPPTLHQLGWTEDHAAAFAQYPDHYKPGRVSCRQKTVWEVLTDAGALTATVSGALKRSGQYPAVGDFVVLLDRQETGTSTIVAILPRTSIFSRGEAGPDGTDQVIAANIDTVFIMTAAGHDLNARRTERYLAIAHASGARPVIVINKSDLADDPRTLTEQLATVAAGAPVITLSAANGDGIEHLSPFLSSKTTIALIGSSGVGKSTLINRLLSSAVQETSTIREQDGRGRHTTTVRQLFILPGGAIMIDNPGIREVGLGTAADGMADTFPDITGLACQCRFSDCRHDGEPGCAVQEAVQNGTLAESRLENYRRLMREIAFSQEKAEIGLVRTERKRWKQIAKMGKEISQGKGRW
ncbi:MAG: ribosome small subunit-dependent GTPase A [Methanomicrobiales archaeon HGW-Methanomicrobiales-3]|nr:MAG: ribosome small subunit-dependent GTPase A [Methanomicrobiales archaeon HGW-Methanomicrobiales-3]